MAFERTWAAVSPQAFTANGTQFGQVTLADTTGFKVKQSAYITANGLPTLSVQIKRVISSTQLIVGTINNAQISSWPPLDISAYTLALNAAIGAPEQSKNNIKPDDIEVATYEADPTVARRVVSVDQYGEFYSENNPLPITLTNSISIGAVEIKGTNGNYIEPNSDGSLNIVVSSSTPPNETVINIYNQVFAIVGGATTQLVSYTVPFGMTAVLQKAVVSGENIARYDLLINGQTQDTIRTMFGGNLSETFDFTTGNESGLPLNAGDIVTVQVLHNRPYAGDFNARIQVLRIS